jgi:putative ABC transport system permease protein
MREFRYAVRTLRRSPGFTATVALTLGLGIAAVTAIFSVVQAVVLQPLPFGQPDQLVRIHNHPLGKPDVLFEASYPNFVEWRQASTQFQDLAGYASSSGGVIVDTGHNNLERVGGYYTSWNLFAMLGATPIAGRPLEATDDVTGGEPVVVIHEDIWRRHFGSDPSVIGTTMKVDGMTRTIVSVLPRAFEYPVGTKIWIPVGNALPAALLTNPGIKFFNLLGRLQDGVTAQQAEAELNTIINTVTNPQLPASQRTGVLVEPLTDELLGDIPGQLWFLFSAAALVLLIACANVANLQTARAIGRQRELAVRRALGATWKTLARQSLAESLLLGVLGGVPGVLLAWWGIHQLLELSPNILFRGDQVAINGSVMFFALLASLITAVMFGLVPSWYGARERIGHALQDAAGRNTSGTSGRRLLSGFVVLQVTLTVVLLFGAGLLLRSYIALHGVDTGFDRERTLTMAVPLLTDKYQGVSDVNEFYDDVIDRLLVQPEVAGAAGVLIRPLQSLNGYDVSLTIQGRPTEEQVTYPTVNYQAVTPMYFEAMAIPVIDGRAFTKADREGAAPVVILGQSVAQRLWPDGGAVGARIKWGGPESNAPWQEVVGVAGDGRYRGLKDVTLNVFAPHRQSTWPLNHLVVRSRGSDPMDAAGMVRRVITEVDPEVQPMDVATTAELVSQAVAQPRFNTVLLGLFAGTALALGIVGLYGLLSYVVALRTKELGIRVALGAEPGAVVRMTLSYAIRLALLGVTVGLVISVGLTRLMAGVLAGILYDTSSLDPVALFGVPAVLLLSALVAGVLPALRAGRVNPLTALRLE